ncbi:MAG: hypothetical protein ABSH20_13770 [Tepidisphaeraceae bacterium]
MAHEERHAHACAIRLRTAPPGVEFVDLDITLDGRRLGELFDCVVEVKSGQ